MYLIVAGPEVLEVAMALCGCRPSPCRSSRIMLQSLVVTHSDALGAALALARVDDDVRTCPPGRSPFSVGPL